MAVTALSLLDLSAAFDTIDQVIFYDAFIDILAFLAQLLIAHVCTGITVDDCARVLIILNDMIPCIIYETL